MTADVPRCATMPAMKSPQERGPIGAWAFEARATAGMSVPEVLAALAARDHRVRDATIRGIESGAKRPGRRLLALLAEIYSSDPPGEQAPAVANLGELADAIRQLADAIQEERSQRADWERGILEALRGLRAVPPTGGRRGGLVRTTPVGAPR